MGHRALVAYQRADGRFDVHFSHRGADRLGLCNDITETTPLGGEASESEFINSFVNALEKEAPNGVRGELTKPQEPTAVESEPKKRALTMPEVCSYLDTYKRSAEALYVVNREFEVVGFRALHVELRDEYNGNILLSARWYDGEAVSAQFDRGWFNAAETTLSNFISEGILSVEDATNRLIEQTLERIKNSPEQQILAHSTGVPSRYYAEYLPAFLKPRGMRRIDGDMTVSSFEDYDPWELPEDFPDPELAKQSGDNEQFNLGNF